METSNNTIINTVVVIVTAIIIVLCWKLLLPNYYVSKNKLETVKNVLSQDKAKLTSIQQAKADLESISDVKDKIFVAISKDDPTPDTISELEAIAIKNNIVLPTIDISQSGDASGGAFSQIKIATSVTGDFQQLSSFITSLEKSIKFMDINNINFGSSEGGKFSLSLQITAYTQSSTVVASAEGE